MEIKKDAFYAPKEVIRKNGGILPVSLAQVYAAIKRGEIPVKKLGSRVMIPGSYLLALVNN